MLEAKSRHFTAARISRGNIARPLGRMCPVPHPTHLPHEVFFASVLGPHSPSAKQSPGLYAGNGKHRQVGDMVFCLDYFISQFERAA